MIKHSPSDGKKTEAGLLAAIACCVALLAGLAGCGGDMLATTTQAQGSSSAASAQVATSDGAASGAATSEGAASGSAGESAEGQSIDAAALADAIQVSVEIDCANAHAYNDKFPESLGSFTVSVPQGGTVLDALDATGVEYGMRGKGYVASIGGIEDRVCGRDSGWLYLVEGTRPLKTANEYALSGGESIVWAYTVTEGDVSWEDAS